MSKNYYDILGVAQTASADEIKKVFRSQAKKHHPDRNKGNKASEAKFKELSEAYDTLSDSTKRKQYDDMLRYGAFTGQPGRQQYDTGQGSYTVNAEGFDGMEDILESFFGGRTARGRGKTRRPQRGQDIEAELTVTLREAIEGVTRTVALQGKEHRLRVNIPSGISDGEVVRLAGQGEASPAGNGDLLITVRVMPSDQFSRKGNDLHTKATVSFKEAILGSKIHVKTITGGSIAVAVPAGTQPGALLRLRGQGVKKGTIVGDMIVEVNVNIPTNITEKQRKLLEDWEK